MNAEVIDAFEKTLTAELDCFFPAALDDRPGGFEPNFSDDWTRGQSPTRLCVYTARMTWTAATVAARRPAMAQAFADYARHGVRTLAEHFWDVRHGGFFWTIDAQTGMPPEPLRKSLYANSFAIYALAAAFATTKDPATLRLATDAFHWLDGHAFEPAHDVYADEMHADGTPDRQTKSLIGTPPGERSMNAHIHLLEAFAELYRVWPDDVLRQRLELLETLIRDRLLAEPGYFPQHYSADWKPVAGRVSYGHDVETAFLLVDAVAALGRPVEPATWAVARRVWDNVLAHGIDPSHGGLFFEGPPRVAADRRQKIWWVQAEALQSILMMIDHFGPERQYVDAFENIWRFTTGHQLDQTNGGWHDELSEDGTQVLRPEKATNWKACYHTGRAMLNGVDLLRRITSTG